jgi:hypothetical protein
LVKKFFRQTAVASLALGLFSAMHASAQITLLATGTLDHSRAGSFADLSGLRYKLENGAPANLLGGLGSAIAYSGDGTFLALPDRGPNAIPYNDKIDDTASYVDRFHTIKMELRRNETGSGLPFTLHPELRRTTLLWSATRLVYGSGGLGVPQGAPHINNIFQHFFTGRSDNFDPNHSSGDARDARLDPEGIRVSNDGRRIYISDEYGPYVYEFDRLTGVRLRSFRLPQSFFVANLSPMGDTEINGNMSGRTANKGMEGLAITPDGRTLVGIMQNALIQDANAGATNLLRIVTIDIASGKTTHQYAYLLTTGSGVSEILALNNHEFLVDERDGHGRANGDAAKVKQLFKIDLDKAVDVSEMDGPEASKHAVNKKLFLDLVVLLSKNGMDATEIPAKIEGIAFGSDVRLGATKLHTLWIANDNDFSETVEGPNGGQIANPNQFFIIGFTDADLAGSKFVSQAFCGK